MKTIKHVTYTWLISQVFHPLIFMIGVVITGSEPNSIALLVSIVFGFICSLPAYLLCLAFFQPVIQSGQPYVTRLVVWCFVVVVCIIAGFLLICVILFDMELFIQEFYLAIPGCIAAVLAILCRYAQFINFRNLQMNSYEDSMV